MNNFHRFNQWPSISLIYREYVGLVEFFVVAVSGYQKTKLPKRKRAVVLFGDLFNSEGHKVM